MYSILWGRVQNILVLVRCKLDSVAWEHSRDLRLLNSRLKACHPGPYSGSSYNPTASWLRGKLGELSAGCGASDGRAYNGNMPRRNRSKFILLDPGKGPLWQVSGPAPNCCIIPFKGASADKIVFQTPQQPPSFLILHSKHPSHSFEVNDPFYWVTHSFECHGQPLRC